MSKKETCPEEVFDEMMRNGSYKTMSKKEIRALNLDVMQKIDLKYQLDIDKQEELKKAVEARGGYQNKLEEFKDKFGGMLIEGKRKAKIVGAVAVAIGSVGLGIYNDVWRVKFMNEMVHEVPQIVETFKSQREEADYTISRKPFIDIIEPDGTKTTQLIYDFENNVFTIEDIGDRDEITREEYEQKRQMYIQKYEKEIASNSQEKEMPQQDEIELSR